MAIEQLIWQADSASDGLAVSGAGEFEEHPVTLAGELGSIATLRRRAEAARGVLGGLLIPLNQITALFGQGTADACAEALRQAQERQEQRAAESQSPT